MKAIRSPERINSSDIIFLAGPIQGTWNWQESVIESLKDLESSFVIASPRRQKIDRKNFTDVTYNEQVDWETEYLRRAKIIVFWLAKETKHDCKRAYAQTTRFELAEWKLKYESNMTKFDLIVGIEPGFSGERYIRRRFEQDSPSTFICDSLESVINFIKTRITLKEVQKLSKRSASRIDAHIEAIEQAHRDAANSTLQFGEKKFPEFKI